jgi:Zn-dependent peptidase ImmA (M78 family)/DNA-binding XRE family transcriptional regulator
LRALAKRVGVSSQAIWKYERDEDVPSSGVLLNLTNALNVPLEFFFRPTSLNVEGITPAYRRRADLTAKQRNHVLGQTRDWLERYIETEELLSIERQAFQMPDGFPYPIRTLEDAEQAALALRARWQLGLDPIENLTELLEDRGVKVGIVDTDEEFFACAFWVQMGEEQVPFIVVRRDLPGDNERLSLAHELGHLLLDIQGDELNSDRHVEKAAFRFAGAFLVPEPTVKFELGEHRESLDSLEPHLLKHKYGLSMQAWVHRAWDTGVLDDESAKRHFQWFRANGFRKAEPGDPYPAEKPTRLERLVMRALVEDVIAESRASELLGKPLTTFFEEVAAGHGGFSAGVRN